MCCHLEAIIWGKIPKFSVAGINELAGVVVRVLIIVVLALMVKVVGGLFEDDAKGSFVESDDRVCFIVGESLWWCWR